MANKKMAWIWQTLFTIILAGFEQMIWVEIAQLPPEKTWFYWVSVSIFLIITFAIVHVSWVNIEKRKSSIKNIYNRFIGLYYSRQTAYSWQIKSNELNLCFEKYPSRKGLRLSLLFKDVRLIGGTDIQKQAIDNAKLFSVKKKTLFHKETPLIDKDVVSIIKKENGTLVFFIPENTELITPFQGKYIYEFYELWESDGNYYYGKSIVRNIVINNKGQIDGEEM
jgi:hypothetical protein